MFRILALLALCWLPGILRAQAYAPSGEKPPQLAREFRAAWIASIYNIDWPSSPGLSAAAQQAELRAILDKLVALKMNAVVFQVRSQCDAMYSSSIEPWSSCLTGTFAIGTALPAGYSVNYATAGTIKLVNGSASPYSSWAAAFSPNPGTAGVDYENDGFKNGVEFILGGSPVSGSDNPKMYSSAVDSTTGGSVKDLVLTIAVPVGTPAFVAGAPATSSYGGFGISVRGSNTLSTFPLTVTPVAPATAGLPTLTPKGGVSYEYRSFRLDGSSIPAGKGFMQVVVTIP